MNNKHRFRAYDNITNNIFDVEVLSNGIAYEDWRDYEDGRNGSKQIMQCLDLVSNNGTLAYQGDIINNYDDKIILLDDLFDIGYMINECTLIDGEFEILGNKYTHPKLLQ